MREAAPKPLTVPVILAAATLTFAAIALLGFVWWTASPIVGRLYAGIRVAESAGLWLLTGWGRYFTGMPAGQPFAFLSIYKSSVPFGVAAGVATAMIGILAYQKRRTRHLDAVLRSPKGGFTSATILRELKPVLPHVPAGGAPASGPTPNLAGASQNPFGELRDLRDGEAVSGAQTSLSWPETAALALLIDTIAPLADRVRHEALLKAVRRSAGPVPAGRAAEPSRPDLATIRATLTLAMCDLTGRSVLELERVHEAVAIPGTLHDAAATLSRIAQEVGRLRLTDYAWLCHVDPLLHAEIAAAQ